MRTAIGFVSSRHYSSVDQRADQHGRRIARAYLASGGDPLDSESRDRYFSDHADKRIAREALVAFACHLLFHATDDRPSPVSGEIVC